MLCSLLFSTIVLLQSAGKIEMPPEPDFKQRIDYVGWYRKQVIGTAKESDNAEPLYEAIHAKAATGEMDIALALGFLGPITDSSYEGPRGAWNPAEHADWEKAFQNTAEIVKAFETAAARPYVYRKTDLADTTTDCEKHLLSTSTLTTNLAIIRGLAKGTLERAFRAQDEKIDATTFNSAVATTLKAARQLEQTPIPIHAMVGISIRTLVYRAVNDAISQILLSNNELISLCEKLKSDDTPIPPARNWLRGEYAICADFLQVAASKNLKMPCDVMDDARLNSNMHGFIQQFRDGNRDARTEMAAYTTTFETIVGLTEQPYAATILTKIDDASTSLRSRASLVSFFVPDISRAYELALRAETYRRATRLILEIHIYHAKNKTWPKSLNELPRDVAEKFATDPFAGKAFAYKVTDDGFMLYSVARNAVDDGGKHDKKWGDKAPGTDYVFWPVQTD